MAEDITRILKEFAEKEGLSGAFMATRSGNFIGGLVPEGQHRDTFVAMTSIIHGGAETISMEMRDPIKHVRVQLGNGLLVVLGVGTTAILALMGKDMGPEIVPRAEALVKDLAAFVR